MLRTHTNHRIIIKSKRVILQRNHHKTNPELHYFPRVALMK